MSQRKFDRFELFQKVSWDLFTEPTGAKTGYISNISQGGCLLKSFEAVEHRRWLRLMIRNELSNITFTTVGRVVRCEDKLEVLTEAETTLHHYGVEFTRPEALDAQALDLILAFSSRNATVRSCRIRNIKSSLRPGFLA